MPAYLIVYMFKTLKIEHTTSTNPDRSIHVAMTAFNPTQLNWAMITAANKWEADGKANEKLKTWLQANKEEFDKDREGANNVTESVFVWEIDPSTCEAIASMMINALKETLTL